MSTQWTGLKYTWDEAVVDGKRLFLLTSSSGAAVIRIYVRDGANVEKVREHVADLCARMNANLGRPS